MRRYGTVFAVSILLAGLRIGGMKHEIFQAVAHLWVGGLCGDWFLTRDRRIRDTIIALSAVEILCALAPYL